MLQFVRQCASWHGAQLSLSPLTTNNSCILTMEVFWQKLAVECVVAKIVTVVMWYCLNECPSHLTKINTTLLNVHVGGECCEIFDHYC